MLREVAETVRGGARMQRVGVALGLLEADAAGHESAAVLALAVPLLRRAGEHSGLGGRLAHGVACVLQ